MANKNENQMCPQPGCHAIATRKQLRLQLFAAQCPDDSTWIETPFLATVSGRDRDGGRFRHDTVLDGLSFDRLALRLPFPVDLSRPLLVVIWVGPPTSPRSSSVIVRGAVAQAEERPGGAWRVSLVFTRHRFLYQGGSLQP